MIPILAESFRPDLVLVSAGFDTHADDPLGGMRMSAPGFAGLARCLMDAADSACGGKLILCLEGGYATDALADSVAAVIRELSGDSVSGIGQMATRADGRKIDHALRRLAHVQGAFWKGLAGLGRSGN